MTWEDQLSLYTDASVRGRFLAKGERSRVGLALAAWCGWCRADAATRPCLSGVAYVGERHGPNSAEYEALILGLHAALLHLRTTGHWVGEVVIHTDSRFVARQMRGEIAVGQLHGWYRRANEALDDLLSEEGIGNVEVRHADKRDPCFKRVHSLTKGWHAVLPEKPWRPEERWRPSAS